MSETCLDVVIVPNEERTPLVCTLELGHEGPHSNGETRWIAG